MHPWDLAKALAEFSPAASVLAVDAGAHMLPLALAWRARTPGSFLISNGLASMGFGLPAAVARSLADPQRPVIAAMGDGGFLMALGELATAARCAGRLTVVVFDDGELSLIRAKQSGREMGRATSVGHVDLASVAAGFGLWTRPVTNVTELCEGLEEAGRRSDPAVLIAKVDPSAYPDLLDVIRG